MRSMNIKIKRTKTGCITCRIRRVKCDETRPHCDRCKSTGRQCDGYSALPFSRRDLHAASTSNSPPISPSETSPTESGALSKLVHDPAFNETLEKRYFQFFRQKTVKDTNWLIEASFWSRTVLQACHTEPAIKHAVLALSAWHQFAQDGTQLQHCEFADKQYQLALHGARNLLSRAEHADIDKVLTACVVFICFENVRGNFKDSQLHMDNGRAIARQHAERLRERSRRQDLTEIQQTLFRLDLPAACFSDRSSPYHYRLEDFYHTRPNLVPYQFKNLSEARDSLIDLSRWTLILGHEIDFICNDEDMVKLADLQAEKEKCDKRLQLWHDFFENLAANADNSMQLLVLNLRQWYHACVAMGIAAYVGPETRWDPCHEHFEIIVSISEDIVTRLARMEDYGASFSYDIGYVIVVFVAASRCRDPYIRRRAIRVLRAIPRQEGLWASIPAAAITERFVELEEEGLEVHCAADVPEARRIMQIDVAANVQERRADVGYGSFDESGQFVVRQEVVRW